jgi:hypothetical protein
MRPDDGRQSLIRLYGRIGEMDIQVDGAALACEIGPRRRWDGADSRMVAGHFAAWGAFRVRCEAVHEDLRDFGREAQLGVGVDVATHVSQFLLGARVGGEGSTRRIRPAAPPGRCFDCAQHDEGRDCSSQWSGWQTDAPRDDALYRATFAVAFIRKSSLRLGFWP